MKYFLITLLLLLSAGCAHIPASTHSVVTYSCESLEPDLCRLADAAAQHCTRAGYVTVRVLAEGNPTLRVVPSRSYARSVFAGSAQLPAIQGRTLVSEGLWPRSAAIERSSGYIEVALRRGVVRDSDIVEMFIDAFEA